MGLPSAGLLTWEPGYPAGVTGQETGVWLRAADCNNGACGEVLNEGDGNVLVRSSHNRDRWVRLTQAELAQVAAIAIGLPAVHAPAVVS